MELRRLRQVMLVAGDLEAQLRFYESTLGLRLQFRDGARWAQLQAGDVSFALAAPEEGMGAPPGALLPVFEVADLDAALTELRGAGHAPGPVREMGAHGRSAVVSDPAGVRLVLHQRPGP